MALPNVFETEITNQIIDRIQKLDPVNPPKWGTMAVAQMLAHCNVTYEMVYEDIHPKPNVFLRFILKSFVKNKVVSETPFEQNGRTAPQFIIKDDKNFNIEKKRLIDYIIKTQQLGEKHFDGLTSPSFGPLTKIEWNNLFYKHLNHHLTQFGV